MLLAVYCTFSKRLLDSDCVFSLFLSDFFCAASLNYKGCLCVADYCCISTFANFTLQIMAVQKELKKQMTATISVPVTKEGRRLETSVARSMEKIVKANIDALWARFQEENVKNQKLLQDRLQQIINVLGNFMNKDLPAALERIVKREVALVQTNVLRAVTPVVEKIVVSAITESFQVVFCRSVAFQGQANMLYLDVLCPV